MNARDRNFTPTTIRRRMEQVDANIVRYLGMLDTVDRQEGEAFELKTARLTTRLGELRRQMRELEAMEEMLTAQAAALNAMFLEMARRSGANMGEYIQAAETYMRLALQAQAQCRATLETLATIKNPPVVNARQANIANGPQQVNNGTAAPRAGDPASPPNELLEMEHGKRLDPGTAGSTIGGDPALEAVVAIDGTTDAGR